MKNNTKFSTLFLDIGGVLLTNGWDHLARKNAALKFNLDLTELELRHHLTFDTYEEGKISLDTYLDRIIYYKKRDFTSDEFKEFMYAQSQPNNEMIKLFIQLKLQLKLKVAVVSNEGRELNEKRINKFKLNEFVDFFISSCFVHLRKPDEDIFKLALDIAQVDKGSIIYVDDQAMFVQVAENLGIKAIHHTDYISTVEKLKSLGLSISDNL